MNMISKQFLVGVLVALTVAGVVNATTGFRQMSRPIDPAIAWTSPKRDDKVVMSKAEWKAKIPERAYRILQLGGTESAFTGKYYNNHQAGTYYCAGCGLPLFSSDAKFDSGTGWPSFYKPIDPKNIWLKHDKSFGMDRIEVRCARCDGHQGHVFDDAPNEPTGLRYCINSDSLTFKPGATKTK